MRSIVIFLAISMIAVSAWGATPTPVPTASPVPTVSPIPTVTPTPAFNPRPGTYYDRVLLYATDNETGKPRKVLCTSTGVLW